MKKLLFSILVLGTLLIGCSEEEQHVEAEDKQVEENTLEKALKEFKQGEVHDYTDARESNDYISVIIHFKDSVGARNQAGGTITNTEKFVKKLDDKPKTVGVNGIHNGGKVVQFEYDVESGEVTLEMATPEVEEYLKQMQYIK